MREYKISFKNKNSSSIPQQSTATSAGIDLKLDSISAIYRFGIFKLSDSKIRKINQNLEDGEHLTIYPFDRIICGNGTVVEMNKDCYAQVCSRSGLAANNGIVVANSPGIIDSDYKEELKTILINTSPRWHSIQRFDRISQLLICVKPQFVIEGVKTLSDVRAGGLGSTGK